MINQNPIIRRLRRVRAKLKAVSDLPRLSIFRSHRHIFAQVIDDKTAKVITAFSTKTKKAKITGTKSEQAQEVGRQIAKLAISKKIRKVKFDRGSYRYHGRVKSLATGAREAGLKF
ncbi:MAG: 50S ribosomal protein L18 [Candidatus Shapirobacteria bacterium]|jgi:large subunit ribosomal protein L18